MSRDRMKMFDQLYADADVVEYALGKLADPYTRHIVMQTYVTAWWETTCAWWEAAGEDTTEICWYDRWLDMSDRLCRMYGLDVENEQRCDDGKKT